MNEAINIKQFDYFKNKEEITIKQFIDRLNQCKEDFSIYVETVDNHNMKTNIDVVLYNEKYKTIKYGKIMDFHINRLPGCYCGCGLTIVAKEDD